MLITVRCFTCGKVLADKYDYYLSEVDKLMKSIAIGGAPKEKDVAGPSTTTKKKTTKASAKVEEPGPSKVNIPHFNDVHTGAIMDKMGLTRYCCRRHMLGTVDMMDSI